MYNTYNITRHLLHAASSGDCPIGWEERECASACPTTCEDYLRPQPKVCPAVCERCACPEGMVVFRDRCVDPLECYTLMNGMCKLESRLLLFHAL